MNTTDENSQADGFRSAHRVDNKDRPDYHQSLTPPVYPAPFQDCINKDNDRFYQQMQQLTQANQPVCGTNTHIFACDHAEKCKCGKSHRTVTPPKCGVCGK